MLDIVLIPLIIAAAAAMLIWAMARHRELADAQRAAAAARPRSRPYATTMPESLHPH